ncbi:hypothetical protein Avbf_01353 [Armadillidium vulgare]|nr:hypothetical protein Avbf_01353 [Armadillidium vulgare]
MAGWKGSPQRGPTSILLSTSLITRERAGREKFVRLSSRRSSDVAAPGGTGAVAPAGTTTPTVPCQPLGTSGFNQGD